MTTHYADAAMEAEAMRDDFFGGYDSDELTPWEYDRYMEELTPTMIMSDAWRCDEVRALVTAARSGDSERIAKAVEAFDGW